MKKIIMTGQKYGRLFVKEEVGKNVLAECECGDTSWYRRGNVLAGYTKSCGCFRNEQTTAAKQTHGHKPGGGASPTYNSWGNMWRRCTVPTHHAHHRYGGRGIKVDTRWESFDNFLFDMGIRPEGKELDRIDNNGNYTKENCRWTTHQENCQNRGD